MRALVTGGMGFIGSAIVKQLYANEWEVDVVDDMSSGRMDALDTVQWANANIDCEEDVTVAVKKFADPSILALVEDQVYDIVFHQAAIPRVSYSVESPLETMQTNLMDTVALFKAASVGNTPIVWASSSSVYGGAEEMPTRESERGNMLPKSPYAMQKYHSEDYAELFGQLYGLRSIGLRYFNVFGPGQHGDSAYATAVSAWCQAIKDGKECRSDGDGEQTRDMCYIDNVVQANLKAADTLLSESGASKLDGNLFRMYNVACGDSVSNNDILTYLKKEYGERVKVHHAPTRAGDVKHTLADISRAEDELGYEVDVRFWEGLTRTLAWWNLK